MGAQVVLTEQSELVPLLQQNITRNFAHDSQLQSAVLSWDRARAR
jgi:hypothetical protein